MWPFTINPNVFRIISCKIFKHDVEGLDIRPENLQYMYRFEHCKGGCFDFLTKYFTVNSSVEPAAHQGAIDISSYSSEKKWATHVYDVSGNLHHGDSIQIPLLGDNLYYPDRPILTFPHRVGCPYDAIAVSCLKNDVAICTLGVPDFLQRIQIKGLVDYSMSEADIESF